MERAGLEEKYASVAHDLETSGLQESVYELEDALTSRRKDTNKATENMK